MKHLFSLIMTTFLALSIAAFAPTGSKVVAQPQASRLVTISETSLPYEIKRLAEEFTVPKPKQTLKFASAESTEVLDTAEDGSLVVRVVESPEIDTKLTFYAVIISAIAVLFSAISLVISVILQIKHNRDEVRPIVAIHLDVVNMSVKIKNYGVGPAVFKEMIWKNVKNNVSSDTLAGLLREEWSKLNLESDFYIYTKPFVGALGDPDVLAPQEELFFIEGDIPDHPMTQDEKRKLRETFRDIEVQLTYTDLYGRKKWTLIKNLSWIANRV